MRLRKVPPFFYLDRNPLIMNALRKVLRDTFGFSGNEINGFLILLPLMLVVVFSEPVYRHWVAASDRDWHEEHQFLDSLIALRAKAPVPAAQVREPAPEPHKLPAFNPNHAPVSLMTEAGLPLRLASRIAAYRGKGGYFTIKSDLLRIYGLDSALYWQLFPRIQLPEERPEVTPRKSAVDGRSSNPSPKPEKVFARFDLNTADTLALKSIYGIGSRLALRIVRFREALGGFVSESQLYEVYGLDSLVVNRLLKIAYISDGFVPEKINVNRAGEQDLARHPYIRSKLARQIAAYRFQHGPFADLDALGENVLIRPEQLERILPYITADD